MREKPYRAIIELSLPKDEYKKGYTLRAKIGIRIARLLGIMYVHLLPTKE
jgi:hypothetical protein